MYVKENLENLTRNIYSIPNKYIYVPKNILGEIAYTYT